MTANRPRVSFVLLVLVISIAFVYVLACIPHTAFADGSQTYSAPGTYSFIVPSYSTLTVTVEGAGGGGGGGGFGCALTGNGGTSGSYSSFNGGVIGYGGGGGGGGQLYGDGVTGTSGGATGGGTNTAGGGAAGGARGHTVIYEGHPIACGNTSYGGTGGAGGAAVKTYTSGELSAGSSVQVVVGTGGTGGAGLYVGGANNRSGSGSPGFSGSVTIVWTASEVPSCSISASPTTINQGSGPTLSWSSSNAASFYITNIGYVAAAGATAVYPSSTITYSGTVTGPGGTAYCSRTISVNRSCIFNGSTIAHGESVTAYQSSSVPFGGTCAAQTRTCTDGTLSGSYAYSSCSADSAANCTLDGVVVPHGSSVTFYSAQTAPVGSSCSAILQSRTCTNGTLTGTAAYQYASCSCAPAYSCSGNTVQYTNASCERSTVATCESPSFCTPGKSSCENDAMVFTSFSATSADTSGSATAFTASGHLVARPALVRPGGVTRLYWNVINAKSCTVSGTNGDEWSQTSSPSSGQVTSPLFSMTQFTLRCTANPGALPATLQETVTVALLPGYQER